jgi:predicted unusual protein kinase regulating ubiquinone biosynthesis (AarF/ABC1/UbiB family)
MTDKRLRLLFKLSEQHPGIPGFLGVPDIVNPPTQSVSGGDDADWSSALIAREKKTVAADILSYEDSDNRKKIFDHILKNTNRFQTNDTSVEKLRSYIYSVSSLVHNYQHGGLSDTQVGQLFEMSEALIQAKNVEKTSSKLGYLYNDLYLARAMQEQKSGQLWHAAISQQIGLYLGKRQPSGGGGFQALIAASAALRLGHASSAAMGFLVAEELELASEHFEFARINRIKALRLAGEFDNARSLITESLQSHGISDEFHLELTWEDMLVTAAATGDFGPMFSMTMRGKPHYQPGYLLESYFWARSLSSQAFIKRLPKLATIKKMGGVFFLRNSPHTALLEAATVLDDCYENSIPLETRLANAARALSALKKMLNFDSELLVQIAFGRWFHRYHQQYLAALAVNEYRALSLGATRGKSDDCLALADDLKTDAWSRFIPASKMEAFAHGAGQTEMIVSPISRALVVSKMTMSLATAMASSKIKTMTMPTEKAEEVMSEYMTRMGTIVVKNLGKLKGPLMKVAQSVSYLPNNIPAEVKAEMEKLQQAAQPLSGEITLRVAEEEYQRPIGDIFADFSLQPFAAGSIGQVHHARLKTGERVAVKIMYPHIMDMVESDMRAIRLTTPLTRKMLPHFPIKKLLEEYHQMLLAECDYRNEARNQERFRDIFRNDPDIVVPKVFHDISTSRVLVTEFIDGFTLKEFVATATQEERNQASELIFEAAYRSMIQIGFFNADPHPGNYLFSDGKVVFLDFGFVREWPEKVRSLLKQMHHAVVKNDLEEFKRMAIAIGWIGDKENYDFQYALDVSRNYSTAPFLHDRPFRFTAELIKGEIQAMVTNNPNARISSYPTDLVAIDRLTWGLNSILVQLGGEANYYRIMQKIMAETDQGPESASA